MASQVQWINFVWSLKLIKDQLWFGTQHGAATSIACIATQNPRIKVYPNELTTEEAKAFVKDIAEFGVKVLLFSGGEPLLRHDLFEIARFALRSGLRTVLSTNGTLITEAKPSN